MRSTGYAYTVSFSPVIGGKNVKVSIEWNHGINPEEPFDMTVFCDDGDLYLTADEMIGAADQISEIVAHLRAGAAAMQSGRIGITEAATT